MSKKILLSLSVIGVVAAIGIGGTVAYFSDTETSTGNTFSTGVIDISIDDQNPWAESWNIEDMKPCETGYITFNIQNPGNNPVNIWKTIKNITNSDGFVTEPECVLGGGVWDKTNQVCDKTGYTAQSWLQGWINYDLSVEVPIADNSDNWYQTIYKDEDNVRISDINGQSIFLGMIPANGSMKVTQSYHLVPETGNWAQADTMTFDIEIYAEQLTGELVLENKTGAPDWQIIDEADNIKATLTYNLTGPTFDYSLTGKAPLIDTKYCLIYYADPWAGDGALIGCGRTASGNRTISFSGSVDLGMDLPDWGTCADENHPEGAKIWLVTASDYNNGSETTGPMTSWTPADYLFDTALMTYTDTDK